MPATDSVLTLPSTATAKDTSGARPSTNLTRAEEANAMPMAGQANNHSGSAQVPVKPASAP